MRALGGLRTLCKRVRKLRSLASRFSHLESRSEGESVFSASQIAKRRGGSEHRRRLRLRLRSAIVRECVASRMVLRARFGSLSPSLSSDFTQAHYARRDALGWTEGTTHWRLGQGREFEGEWSCFRPFLFPAPHS